MCLFQLIVLCPVGDYCSACNTTLTCFYWDPHRRVLGSNKGIIRRWILHIVIQSVVSTSPFPKIMKFLVHLKLSAIGMKNDAGEDQI